jgi:hypothetical protein
MANRPFDRLDVINHIRYWRTIGGRQGTNMRFGQWWFNQYWTLLGIDSCPELFYCENTSKALNYIIQHFTKWNTD